MTKKAVTVAGSLQLNGKNVPKLAKKAKLKAQEHTEAESVGIMTVKERGQEVCISHLYIS